MSLVRHGCVLLTAGLAFSGLSGCQSAPKTRSVLVSASDGGPVLVPAGMAEIPGGVCERGDGSGEVYPDEVPVGEVRVAGFFMDRTEVSWGLWDTVFRWALDQGYSFGEDYVFHPNRDRLRPVCFVSWHDAVKWCNARSEREGRTPVYRTGVARAVYRTGEWGVTESEVLWEGDGYRLPTEVEWEWAARGGLAGQHYPWAGAGSGFERFLDGTRANYWGSGDPWESDADCATTPVAYYDGGQEPAGTDMANGYGLYDMAGNVSEWCWDWYLDTWYGDRRSVQPDTRGPESGYGRVLRGGSWISSAKYCRVAARYMSEPSYRCHCYGLRCVVSRAR